MERSLVDKYLQKGELAAALDELIQQFKSMPHTRLYDEALGLKSMLEQGKRQFNIQQVISAEEYQRIQNRVLVGIQHLLAAAELSIADETSSNEPSSVKTNNFGRAAWLLGTVLLLAVLTIWWWQSLPPLQESFQTSTRPETPTAGVQATDKQSDTSSDEGPVTPEQTHTSTNKRERSTTTTSTPPTTEHSSAGVAEKPTQTQPPKPELVYKEVTVVLSSPDSQLYIDDQPAEITHGANTQFKKVRLSVGSHRFKVLSNQQLCQFEKNITEQTERITQPVYCQ